MKKRILLVCALLSFSTASYANWFQDIINAINKQAGITNDILGREFTIQKDMLSSQKDIQGLMNQVNRNLRGHSGYGNYGFHDYQSYGMDAGDWMEVISMAERGQGNGALGKVIHKMSREFPINQHLFNRSVSDVNAQRYYAMKSGTVLAARAASQLDFNKIQDQIAYQKMLMDQIEQTDDLKAAMDLSNRIQAEGNLINLEILRQSALVNQQQAVTEQAAVISALANARFLSKE